MTVLTRDELHPGDLVIWKLTHSSFPYVCGEFLRWSANTPNSKCLVLTSHDAPKEIHGSVDDAATEITVHQDYVIMITENPTKKKELPE